MPVPGKLWRWLGVAGVAGVAATGVVVARDQRRRRTVSPEEVRDRLHQRVAEAASGAEGSSGTTPTDRPAGEE